MSCSTQSFQVALMEYFRQASVEGFPAHFPAGLLVYVRMP